MRQYIRIAPELRFWPKVALTANPNKCWEWQGAKDSNGYGRFNLGGHSGKIILAHRYAWELLKGKFSDELDVCHHCDNPSCVNPAHLFLGTHKDNMNDRDNKGRYPHRLTYAEAQRIRAMYAQGGITQKAIGQEFGISPAQVWQIVNFRQWKSDRNGS